LLLLRRLLFPFLQFPARISSHPGLLIVASWQSAVLTSLTVLFVAMDMVVIVSVPPRAFSVNGFPASSHVRKTQARAERREKQRFISCRFRGILFSGQPAKSACHCNAAIGVISPGSSLFSVEWIQIRPLVQRRGRSPFQAPWAK